MKNSTKAQKHIEMSGVEMNMRVVFSNLDALRRVPEGASLEKRLRRAREEWKVSGKFVEWHMEVVDACYEAVMRGRGWGGVEERKKKNWYKR